LICSILKDQVSLLS